MLAVCCFKTDVNNKDVAAIFSSPNRCRFCKSCGCIDACCALHAGLPVKKLDKGVSHRDAPVLGLILYGTSSIFLSTMLVFAKLLGIHQPTLQACSCCPCYVMSLLGQCELMAAVGSLCK